MVLLAVADEATIKQIDKYKGMIASLTDPRKTTEEQAQQLIQDGQADLLDHERHALDRDRRARDADRAAVPARGRGDAVHPGDPQQRHHAHHAGDRGGRPREAGRHLLLQQEAPRERGAAAADVLGQVRRARQQPRRHGPVPRADAQRDEDVPRLEADDHARPARGVDLSLRVDRHRPVQRADRSDHDRRVVAARQDRSDGDDQARRARRVDLRVLRRLGAELHVLHRALAQRDRPVLRGDGLRAGESRGQGGGGDDEPRVVPAESAAAVDPVGSAQQHQHPAVGDPDRAQSRREEQGDVSRELLAEEQACRRQGEDRSDVRLGDSRRRRSGRRTRPTRSTSCGGRVSRCTARRRPSRPAPSSVKAGDYIVRGDQPYRTIADMYFSVQNYAPANPRPYDDTGWTFQFMRNLVDQAGRRTRRFSSSR